MTVQNFSLFLIDMLKTEVTCVLNNVTIGYDLPIGENNAIKGANIYVTGQNLLTLTNYGGYDPEITSFMWTGLISGVDWNGPPNSRNILIGLNLNF